MSLLYSEPYIALSYCWGDPNSEVPIDVNGHSFRATANLHEALLRLRNLGKYKVWADAVCINQGDRQERSLQVRLMKQIFSKAKEVIACVGTPSAINMEAMSVLSQPPCLFPEKHRHRQSLVARLRIKGSKNSPDPDYSEDLKSRIQGIQGSGRTALDQFFALPYWKRVWIVQEVSVAAKVTIVCGNQWMGWDLLSIADAFYQESESDGWSYVKQLILFRDEFRQGQRPSLFHAITQTRESLSTDPRDKIFALLGLCHDGEHLVPYPNYKQSELEILRDFTKAVLSTRKNLDFLFLRRLPVNKTISRPTWTVEWLAFFGQSNALLDSLKPKVEFNLLDTASPDILSVHGVYLGTIQPLTSYTSANRGHTPVLRGPSIPLTKLAYAIWAGFGIDIDGSGYDKDDRTRSFFFSNLWTEDGMCQLTPSMHARILEVCRALYDFSGEPTAELMDWGPRPNIDSSSMNRDQRRRFERDFIDWLEDLGTLEIFGHALWKLQKYTTEYSKGPEPRVDNLIKRLLIFYQNSLKLFFTARGLIGVGHTDIAFGDKLYHLQGCSWPVALRQVTLDSNNAYQFIGGTNVIYGVDDARKRLDAGLKKLDIINII